MDFKLNNSVEILRKKFHSSFFVLKVYDFYMMKDFDVINNS